MHSWGVVQFHCRTPQNCLSQELTHRSLTALMYFIRNIAFASLLCCLLVCIYLYARYICYTCTAASFCARRRTEQDAGVFSYLWPLRLGRERLTSNVKGEREDECKTNGYLVTPLLPNLRGSAEGCSLCIICS